MPMNELPTTEIALSKINLPRKSAPLVFVYCLNIIAAFAVVLLHTTLPVYQPVPTIRWSEMVVLQAIAICATPLFFMISGMNLLGYRERYSTKVFFKKRFLRVGRALLAGSIICYLLYSMFPLSFYGAESYAESFGFRDFVERFLMNRINDTYWFLYSIIYLYVLTPMLSLIVGNRRCLEYILALNMLVAVCFPFLTVFGLNPEYMQNLFGWPMFTSLAMMYYLAGYYFHTYWKPIRRQGLIAGAIYVACAVAMSLLGLWQNRFGHVPESAGYNPFFVGIASPFCVVESIALFLLVQSMERWLQQLPERVMLWLKLISGASLGTYLFQILVVNWIRPGVISRVLNKLSAFPFLKAVAIYVSVAAAVMVGKWLMARAKRLWRSHTAN